LEVAVEKEEKAVVGIDRYKIDDFNLDDDDTEDG
jgi:hypothetical protein